MTAIDYLVLCGYFALMATIGFVTMRRIKVQEDYFMGGRRFGKLLQTFAAFGAGTGSADPVNTARTTWTSGFSGMWSVMYWLFVTPFYWITGVWYRRMRHLTLGDWYVERYESRALGAWYCLFGIGFFMVYGSMMFSAIGKVAAPLVGFETVSLAGGDVPIEYILVPVIGVVVLVYGIAGGLKAAYWTDLVQGIFIIMLSVILIPAGLAALVEKFGSPGTEGMLQGFRILHEQLPEEQFTIVGATSASEFPWYRIAAIVLINLIGVAVQPHFIATGGGSARNELSARVGLVTGNFLKRICTVGWALTALIVLALFADNPEIAEDPDRVWGIASRELLSPLNIGLVGLMLACLLAALMSSVDAYMVVGSALVVRNIYAPYFNRNATEKEYVRVGRLTGAVVVVGAVIISLFMMDVFRQLQLTWIFGVTFAAPFWVGMWWRRATRPAAWITVAYCAVMFFLIPWLAPVIAPGLRVDPAFSRTTPFVETVHQRKAAPSDVAKREGAIEAWTRRERRALQAWSGLRQETTGIESSLGLRGPLPATPDAGLLAGFDSAGIPGESPELAKALEDFQQAWAAFRGLGPRPEPIRAEDNLTEVTRTGGKAVFWTGGVAPVDESGRVLEGVAPEVVSERTIDAATKETVKRYASGVRLKGLGDFNADLVAYGWLGMDLAECSDAALDTLNLPPKIITPFIVMVLLSFITRKNRKEILDRYYVKMKVPVLADPAADAAQLEAAYRDPEAFEKKKLFPGTSLEIGRPTWLDLTGFVVSLALCFAVIGLAAWVAGIGAP